MDIQQFKYNFQDFELRPSDLASIMGYTDGIMPDPFPEMVQEILQVANEYCTIEGGYALHEKINFNKEDATLTVDSVTFDIKKIVSGQIRKSEKIALFVCTAGPGIGNWSKKLMAEGDLLKGYVVDVVGSIIVEAAMDRIQESLSLQMKEKQLNLTNRYSPGYCGWVVAEQQKLFSFFPENFCGIRLSDTSLMYPIKSVSGIIGIGKEVKMNPYTCLLCDFKNCIYRGRQISKERL